MIKYFLIIFIFLDYSYSAIVSCSGSVIQSGAWLDPANCTALGGTCFYRNSQTGYFFCTDGDATCDNSITDCPEPTESDEFGCTSLNNGHAVVVFENCTCGIECDGSINESSSSESNSSSSESNSSSSGFDCPDLSADDYIDCNNLAGQGCYSEPLMSDDCLVSCTEPICDETGGEGGDDGEGGEGGDDTTGTGGEGGDDTTNTGGEDDKFEFETYIAVETGFEGLKNYLENFENAVIGEINSDGNSTRNVIGSISGEIGGYIESDGSATRGVLVDGIDTITKNQTATNVILDSNLRHLKNISDLVGDGNSIDSAFYAQLGLKLDTIAGNGSGIGDKIDSLFHDSVGSVSMSTSDSLDAETGLAVSSLIDSTITANDGLGYESESLDDVNTKVSSSDVGVIFNDFAFSIEGVSCPEFEVEFSIFNDQTFLIGICDSYNYVNDKHWLAWFGDIFYLISMITCVYLLLKFFVFAVNNFF